MRLYIYEQTTSTNDLGKIRTFKEGDLIWAKSQTAGRGQRGNRWHGERSDGGENLTLSIVIEPKWLAAADQYFISQITALALVETLRRYGIESKIKWTNDIYIGDYKVAGVLIENSLSDGVVSRSVIGIGLNVNQLSFDDTLPNPISMANATGRSFTREEVLTTLYNNFMTLYNQRDREKTSKLYNAQLYRLNEIHPYRLPNGTLIDATITGVAPRGELQLVDVENRVSSYLFKEIEFVILPKKVAKNI